MAESANEMPMAARILRRSAISPSPSAQACAAAALISTLCHRRMTECRARVGRRPLRDVRFRDVGVIGMQGAWRRPYVIAATIALWTNMFALVAQSFGKISALHALAPTQSEPPFLIAEVVMLIVFVVLGVAAARKFHPVMA